MLYLFYETLYVYKPYSPNLFVCVNLFFLQVMCRLFVENLSEKEIQISVFYYWVLDICECCEELLQVKMREKVKECLKLNREKALLIECVWLLDHNLYKVGFYMPHVDKFSRKKCISRISHV